MDFQEQLSEQLYHSIYLFIHGIASMTVAESIMFFQQQNLYHL